MNLTEILDELSKLEEFQLDLYEKEKKEVYIVDPSTFHFDFLIDSVILSGNALLEIDSHSGLSNNFYRIFGIPNHQMKNIPTEERLHFIDLAMKEAQSLKLDDENFFEIFDDEYNREKDRLRLITKGVTKVEFISLESENEIFQYFKEIFHHYLEFYFLLISKNKLYEKSLSSILKIIETKGTYVSFHHNCKLFGELFSHTEEDKKDYLKKKLHDWYQEKELTFFHKYKTLQYHQFEFFSFLLNNEQKKEVIQQFKNRLEDGLRQLKVNMESYNKDGFSKNHLDQIKSLKTSVEKLMKLEKES